MTASALSTARRVRLFRNGRSQAVRIPREFELPGGEVIMRREGERIVIEPAPRRSLRDVLASLETLDEELVDPIDAPPRPVDL
jgi:antitoxin VapB